MSDAQQAAAALFFEGNRLMAAGDAAGAEACLREALRLAPDLAEAHGNLGYLLDQRGASIEAEACHRRAVALNPAIAQTHLNLGANLAQKKRFDEAEKAYREAIRLNPSPAAWSNLGVLYACVKHESEAEQCYRSAMAIDADHANTRFNLSYLLLRQGRFEEGWRCLEARDWYTGLEARIACPRWRGEVLAGKSLLIGVEAGHGDMIQFCRYAATLKRQGASNVAVLCHPALKTLFATLDGVDEVVAIDEPMPPADWDFWTPPLSLPYYCNTRLDSIPAALPYLRADPERVARWAPQLPPPDGVRVGLVWKGSTNFENDADRSLPSLDILAPLGQVAGARFVSLQKGAGEDEAKRPPHGLSLVELGSRVADFADTAAIIANIDLVICVDTAVAHLAGALGKPCWVLLPDYKTDWRWLTGRSDSPWYPNVMHLFRQETMGSWTPVIAAVRAALESFVARSPNHR